MEAWRAKFKQFQELWQENDEEDELMMNVALNHLQQALVEHSALSVLSCGSQRGRARNLDRERLHGHNCIYADYFSDTPIYEPAIFCRRFRMRQPLFVHIMERVCAQDSYFIQKPDALGLMRLSSIQKCTAALQMLAYGVSVDATDEYCRIGVSTAMEAMKRFCAAIWRGITFDNPLLLILRNNWPSKKPEDSRVCLPLLIACIMFGRIARWLGKVILETDGDGSIILEAIADKSLQIWHIFFGMPGANNDINVLDWSPLVQNMLTRAARDRHFVVNGVHYNRYYLLADSIYPHWTYFVQIIHKPVEEKCKHFAKPQEGARKDVERRFGVLQFKFYKILVDNGV